MHAAHLFSWHDVWRYTHVWIYLLKWPLAFVAGWAAIYIGRWRKNRNENAAQGWPSIEGRIQSGKVAPIPKTSRSIATLNYTYFVEEYRTGKYVHEFTNEDDADNFVRTMKDKQRPDPLQAIQPRQVRPRTKRHRAAHPAHPRFG